MKDLIIVRGGGDIATGTIYKLVKSGFHVLILEIAHPSAIRRNVAFSEAVYEEKWQVEDMTCHLAHDIKEAEQIMKAGNPALMIDPNGEMIKQLHPIAVVDAILAKKNLGTTRDMAPITIALGPGFTAGEDVDVVIETMRGHRLGRIIKEGSAIPNTGIPGVIKGFGKERVIHSPAKGILRNICHITDMVSKGQLLAKIETPEGTIVDVAASMDGLLRGLIRDGYPVTKGFKIADIDPRAEEYDNCFTISDKARCIAGGVLEALLYLKNNLSDQQEELNVPIYTHEKQKVETIYADYAATHITKPECVKDAVMNALTLGNSVILDAAKVSAASGGNNEPKQGQRSQSARGFCPRSTMRVPQPDIIEHFGNADAVPQLPERCLSRKAGIVRCCLKFSGINHSPVVRLAF